MKKIRKDLPTFRQASNNAAGWTVTKPAYPTASDPRLFAEKNALSGLLYVAPVDFFVVPARKAALLPRHVLRRVGERGRRAWSLVLTGWRR